MAENTEIMARFIHECWNVRNRAICKELLAPGYEHFMPGAEHPTVGPDAYQELVDHFVAAFPDIRFAIDDLFGEGDRVCLVWTARGTHQGAFNGLPPTNRPVVMQGVGVGRIVNGQIVRIVSMFDNDSFTKQLDAPAEMAAESWRKTARSA
jgi:steroid delta-isomerase-like uncharacterized protein